VKWKENRYGKADEKGIFEVDRFCGGFGSGAVGIAGLRDYRPREKVER
jgi:hypothetical protein